MSGDGVCENMQPVWFGSRELANRRLGDSLGEHGRVLPSNPVHHDRGVGVRLVEAVLLHLPLRRVARAARPDLRDFHHLPEDTLLT
jgi:hypothetical protein